MQEVNEEQKQLTFADLENATATSPVRVQTLAIKVVMLHLQYVRWSYSQEKLFANDPSYNKALLILIEKFGIENFILALKQMFDSDLANLDITNLEYGPHSDITPFGSEGQRFAKKMLNECHPIPNTSDSGYLVNVKTSFGDIGLWRFLLTTNGETQHCYENLITHIKSWPTEFNNSAMYNQTKQFNPMQFFAKYFPDAFCFIEQDLFFNDVSLPTQAKSSQMDLISLSPGKYQIVHDNYLYIWSLGEVRKTLIQQYLLVDTVFLGEKELTRFPLSKSELDELKILILQHLQQRSPLQEWLKEYSFEWEQFCLQNKSNRFSTNQLEGLKQLCAKVFGVKPEVNYKKNERNDTNFLGFVRNSKPRSYVEIIFKSNEVNLEQIACKLKLFMIDFYINKSENSFTIISLESFVNKMERCLLVGALSPRAELFLQMILKSNPKHQTAQNSQTKHASKTELVEKDSIIEYTQKYLEKIINFLPEICFGYPSQQAAIINWIIDNVEIQNKLGAESFIDILAACPSFQDKLFACVIDDTMLQKIVKADFVKFAKSCPKYKSIILARSCQDIIIPASVFRSEHQLEKLAKIFTETNERQILVRKFLAHLDLSLSLGDLLKHFSDQHELIFNALVKSKVLLLNILSTYYAIDNLKHFSERYKNDLFNLVFNNNQLLAILFKEEESLLNFMKSIVTTTKQIEQLCDYIINNSIKVKVVSWYKRTELLRLCKDRREQMLSWTLTTNAVLITDDALENLLKAFPTCMQQVFDYLVNNQLLHDYLKKEGHDFYKIEKLLEHLPQHKKLILDTIFNDKELLYEVLQDNFWKRTENMIKIANYIEEKELKKQLLDFILQKFNMLDYHLESSYKFLIAFEGFEESILDKILEIRTNKLPDIWDVSRILEVNSKTQPRFIEWLLSDVDRFKRICGIDQSSGRKINISFDSIFKQLNSVTLKQQILDFVIQNQFMDLLLFSRSNIANIAETLSSQQREQVFSLLLQNSKLRNKTLTNHEKVLELFKGYPEYVSQIMPYLLDSKIYTKLFAYVSQFVSFFGPNIHLEAFRALFANIKHLILGNELLMEYFIDKDAIICHEAFIKLLGDEAYDWFEIVLTQPQVKQKLFSCRYLLDDLFNKSTKAREKVLELIGKDNDFSQLFFSGNYLLLLKNFDADQQHKALDYVFNNSVLFTKLVNDSSLLKILVKQYPQRAVLFLKKLLADDGNSKQVLNDINILIILADFHNSGLNEIIANKIIEFKLKLADNIRQNTVLCFLAKHFPVLQSYLLQLLSGDSNCCDLLFRKPDDLKRARAVFVEKLLLDFLLNTNCYLKCVNTFEDITRVIKVMPQLQDGLLTNQLQTGSFQLLLKSGDEVVELLRLINEENSNKVMKFILEDSILMSRCFQSYPMLSAFLALEKSSANTIVAAIVKHTAIVRLCFYNLGNLKSLFENYAIDPEVKETLLSQLLSGNTLRLSDATSNSDLISDELTQSLKK